MSLHDVIRKTLLAFKEQGIPMTPQHYHDLFCKEAKKLGIIIEECNLVEKYLARLDKATKTELSNYHLRTVDELFAFIAAKINRMEPSACQNELKSMRMLAKRMADVATTVHNKELSLVANYTLQHLDTAHTAASVDILREKWVGFLTTYNDSFLDKLGAMCRVDKEDLERTVEHVIQNFKGTHEMVIPDHVAQLLIEALTPSIAPYEAIRTLGNSIRENPSSLDTLSVQNEVRNAIAKRIELDKQALKETLFALDEIADEVSKRLLSIMEQSAEKKEALGAIKAELTAINFEDITSHKLIHERLLHIATLLEEETHTLHSDVQTYQQQIAVMDHKIAQLEHKLSDVTKESREDFLTGAYNKRALDEKLRELDAGFRRFGRDYIVLFVDIDHFKKINDTYGHDAGDAVLKVLAKLLKKESRANDFVARYGGEEFVLVLPEITLEGAKRMAAKLSALLQKNRFVYKEHRIALTVSGGIALRSEWENNREMIKHADELLYVAKQNGRNQILPL